MNTERYEEIAATVACGIGCLVRDHDDTPGAVKDHIQPMLEELLEAYNTERYNHLVMESANRANAERGNEFEAAYEQALNTIVLLKNALRNIVSTTERARGFEGEALSYINGEASRALNATYEPLAPDEMAEREDAA